MKSNQGLQNEHPRVINFVSLQFKEYTQSRLYQIRLNCFNPYIDLSDTQYMLWFYVWVGYVNSFPETSQTQQIK
jgi:hypothetical protein